jgi:class 3 adenylate cyclase/tetratricopeptide (TPR) repeat protein
MTKIFVSYARSTLPQARLIADTLRGGGHEVWIDEQLLAHRSFTDAIEEQLEAAEAVVVVWSPDAVASEWVRAEASRARKAGKLVQIRLGRCSLPMPYDQIHCIDLASWSGDYQAPAWRALQASLAAVTGQGHSAPVTAPSRPATPRLAPVDRRGERRQVTALFCDLAGSASMASRLDPEDMMQVLDAYQAACEDIITHNGGSIAKYMGHGVLAYFGYPRGDEEAAANAVRAGLALRDAVAALDLPPGVEACPRVGVATGLVVVSELVGRETGVVGETPTLAGQLESIAAPGTVVVAEGTRRITDGLFVFRDLGAQALPGYATPTRAFEAVAATDLGSRSEARAHRSRTPLFGRERELAQMSEAWELARNGEGQVILVQGEAGMGKSGLVDAFRRHIAETPSARVTFHCAPNYSEAALHPVAEQFARAAGFEHADTVERRSAKLRLFLERFGDTGRQSHPVVADLLGIPPEASAGPRLATPERRKAATLDALLALMEPLSEDGPALFVFEDLHWADPTTLEFLDLVTRQAADRSWLILGTARPEFEARWFEHADVIHIQLGRLDGGDAERICLSLGAEALLSPEDIRQIIARSDGVPLFVQEVTRAAIEAVESAPSGDGAPRVNIPETLHDSLVARLDRLGPAKPIACLGASIGRRFSYELLAAVAPQPAGELRQALRELTKSGLVERTGTPPSSHYLFKHALVRDAAYEGLLKREREALHGRIAAALRDRFPETRLAEPALLAFHLTESGATAEAIPLWMEAGRRAASRAAHLEAASHLRMALNLLRRQPRDEARSRLELQLLLALAPSLCATRGFSGPEMATVLAEAGDLCDALGDDVAGLCAFLASLSTVSIVSGDFEAANAAAHRVMEIGERTGMPEPRIEGPQILGGLAWIRGDLAQAKSYYERAADTYRAVDGATLTFSTPMDPLVLSLSTLALILGATGDAAGAERVLGDLTAHAALLEQPFALAFGFSYYAAYDLLAGNPRRALQHAQEVLTISETNGYGLYAAAARVFKASAMPRGHDLAAAIAMAKQGIAEWTRDGTVHWLAFFEGELADLQAAAGDIHGALATIDVAIAHAHEFTEAFFLSPLMRRRAEILARLPGVAPGAVEAALREAIAVAETQGAAAYAARARSLLAGAPA